MVKKQLAKKKSNPFDLRFSRVKHNVLGRRANAGEIGRPAVSRKRGVELRKRTLNVEAENIFKVNKIIDNRKKRNDNLLINKSGRKITLEDEAPPAKRSLTSIQKYEMGLGDDVDVEADEDILERDAFGQAEPTREEKPSTPANRKKAKEQKLVEMIAKTKQERLEKHTERDVVERNTNKLDDLFTKLRKKLPKERRGKDYVGLDDYDKMILDLKMTEDKRATPSERTKSLEELAAEEREKLEEMERRRRARMELKSDSIREEQSTDAEVLKKKVVDEDKLFRLEYDKKGRLAHRDEVESEKSRLRNLDQTASDEEGDLDEDEEEADEEDLEDIEEDLDEEEDEAVSPPKKRKPEAKKASSVESSSTDDSVPFVIPLPKSYSQLGALLGKYPASKSGIVLERLIKLNHPSLNAGNKAKLAKFTVLLLRYFSDLCKMTPTSDSVTQLSALIQHLYTLVKLDVEHGTRCIRAIVRQLWKELLKEGASSHFLLFALSRLVETVYCVSDLWHPACSPMVLLICQHIAQAKVSTPALVARQLLIIASLSDYMRENKRLLPEVMTFLRGALLTAVPGEKDDKTPAIVFPISEPYAHMLLTEKDLSKTSSVAPLKLTEVFDDKTKFGRSDVDKVRVVRALVGLISTFAHTYSARTHSFEAIFRPFLELLQRLPSSEYPTEVSQEVDELVEFIEEECIAHTTRLPLAHAEQKKMLMMLEPAFEDEFNANQPHASTVKERVKARRAVNREKKSAIKELRKDAVFMADRQRKMEVANDAEKQLKVNKLMKGLRDQQHEKAREKVLIDSLKKRSLESRKKFANN